MSQIKRIRQMPTVIDNRHERLNRSYQLMGYVRELLELDTPPSVVLEIMDACYEKELPQLHKTTWQEMREDKPPLRATDYDPKPGELEAEMEQVKVDSARWKSMNSRIYAIRVGGEGDTPFADYICRRETQEEAEQRALEMHREFLVSHYIDPQIALRVISCHDVTDRWDGFSEMVIGMNS